MKTAETNYSENRIALSSSSLRSLFSHLEFNVRDEVRCPLELLPCFRAAFPAEWCAKANVAFLSASNSLHSCRTCWADCSASPHYLK